MSSLEAQLVVVGAVPSAWSVFVLFALGKQVKRNRPPLVRRLAAPAAPPVLVSIRNFVLVKQVN